MTLVMNYTVFLYLQSKRPLIKTLQWREKICLKAEYIPTLVNMFLYIVINVIYISTVFSLRNFRTQVNVWYVKCINVICGAPTTCISTIYMCFTVLYRFHRKIAAVCYFGIMYLLMLCVYVCVYIYRFSQQSKKINFSSSYMLVHYISNQDRKETFPTQPSPN